MSSNSAFTQELSSAKYFTAEQLDLAPEATQPDVQFSEPAPASKGIESAMKWVGPFVLVMVVSAAGATAWKNRDKITSTAGSAYSRSSNPFDLVLWIGGSKHSTQSIFSEIEDRINTPVEIPEVKVKIPKYNFSSASSPSKWQFPSRASGNRNR